LLVGFFERHAWQVFATLSVILVTFGVGDMMSGGATFQSGEVVLFKGLTGTSWDELRGSDPGAAKLIDHQVRTGGLALLAAGLFSLAISLTALRRGERWAWMAMWTWPLWVVLIYPLFWVAEPHPSAGTPVPIISGTIFLVITVATLGLSYRRYLRGPETAQTPPG
jgi:hypothetical protein